MLLLVPHDDDDDGTGWIDTIAVFDADAEAEKGDLMPARSTSREVRVWGWR